VFPDVCLACPDGTCAAGACVEAECALMCPD
jgi:hypothetical protein